MTELHIFSADYPNRLTVSCRYPSGRAGMRLYDFKQSLHIIDLGAIHSCISPNSVSAVLFSTSTINTFFLLFLSHPQKTHPPTTQGPTLYFLLANLDSSISTTMAYPPIFSLLFKKHIHKLHDKNYSLAQSFANVVPL